MDLSHPKGHSVNDGILPHLCSLQYVTIDEAIKGITQLGQGTLLAKIDVKCLLSASSPSSRQAFTWNGMARKDIHRHLPSLWFEVSPQTLQCPGGAAVLDSQAEECVVPDSILRRFLTMGPSSSSSCQHNLDTIIKICNYLAVPLVLEKVESPSSALPFLGIMLDTIKMEARLPNDKLGKLKDEVA